MKNIIKLLIITIASFSPTLIFSAAAAAARPTRPALIIEWPNIQKNAQRLADEAFEFTDKPAHDRESLNLIEEMIEESIRLLNNAKDTADYTGNGALAKEVESHRAELLRLRSTDPDAALNLTLIYMNDLANKAKTATGALELPKAPGGPSKATLPAAPAAAAKPPSAAARPPVACAFPIAPGGPSMASLSAAAAEAAMAPSTAARPPVALALPVAPRLPTVPPLSVAQSARPIIPVPAVPSSLSRTAPAGALPASTPLIGIDPEANNPWEILLVSADSLVKQRWQDDFSSPDGNDRQAIRLGTNLLNYASRKTEKEGQIALSEQFNKELATLHAEYNKAKTDLSQSYRVFDTMQKYFRDTFIPVIIKIMAQSAAPTSPAGAPAARPSPAVSTMTAAPPTAAAAPAGYGEVEDPDLARAIAESLKD